MSGVFNCVGFILLILVCIYYLSVWIKVWDKEFEMETISADYHLNCPKYIVKYP